MQDELLQFKLLKVWTLVDLPRDKWEIGTKWVFINKKDKRGIVVKNKARLVAQGHTQEECIDYDEVFAPVVRIEAIRLFLAYASLKDFVVYQMDVKSSFLYGKIEEEVYVCQPPGFEDPYFPDKVYKVEKALYGLHQAPRAWYKDDILLVQVYVDDVIFGSTKKEMSTEFEKLMHDKFQMSSMRELSFFLGLQIASTLMETNKALIKDEEAKDVDVHLYRSMIGSLMYLTTSRPDVMFSVCAYARDSPFDLEDFSDSDYTGASLDRKSTTGGCQFLGKRLISWQCKKQTIVANSITKVEYVAAANCCGQHIEIRHHIIRDSYEKKLIQVIKIHTDQNVADLLTKAFDASSQELLKGHVKSNTSVEYVKPLGKSKEVGKPRYLSLVVPLKKVGNEAVHKELGDRMERAATTASSLEAEQDSGSGPRCQDTILGDVNVQTRFETTSKQSNDPPLSKVNTFGSSEDIMQLIELMIHSTKLSALATAKVKTVNDVRQIQALIDKKKLIITESSIRSNLYLEDAGAFFSPQWKFLIHTITQCLSVKSTAWNEFSSTMASLIICLATNQKFNLSRYIFDAMVKHLDGGVKFLMYPRFLQVFINQQLGDMSHHKKIYVNPSYTKKFFANMKREGNDFSGRITPLFDTMMVQASEEMGEDSDHPIDSNQIPIVDQPSISSPPKKKQKSKRKQRKEAEVAHDETEHEESIPTPFNDPLPSGEDSMQLNDLMVLCTKLQKQVFDLEKAKFDQAIEIASLKKSVDKLEKRSKSRTTGLKRLKKVGAARRIESSNDSLGAQEDASKQGRRIEDIDADAEVTLVNKTQERQDKDLMFDTRVMDGDEMFLDARTGEKDEQSTKINDSTAGEAVTTAGIEDSASPTDVEDTTAPTIPTRVEETLDQTLMEIKAAKPNAKGIVFHDLEKQVSKPTVFVTQPSIKDKGKGIMQEPERPLTKKDQVVIDEDLARNIQAQLDAEIIEEERLKRQKKEEANIALIESWENTQAMMEADRLLAERLQTREREELTDVEK
ncbi:putative ribonuclease H-like domain-containing protein [Tanacetum coccineum]